MAPVVATRSPTEPVDRPSTSPACWRARWSKNLKGTRGGALTAKTLSPNPLMKLNDFDYVHPTDINTMVPTARLELAQLSPLPPQDSVSTNSTTSAGKERYSSMKYAPFRSAVHPVKDSADGTEIY